MSFLRRGERRRGRVATAATTVAVLGAFQVLAIIGAGTASAVTGCTYNPATDTINITIDPGQSAGLMVETTAANIDANAPAGAILFDNNGAGFGLDTACGSASNTNTVAIVVLGSPGNDETFYIDENTGATFATSIVWSVDLGTSTVAGDWLEFYLNDDVENTLTLTNGTFDLNGAAGELLGVENFYVEGGADDDVLDGSALTNYFEAYGLGGDDWIAPGTFDGDYMEGGAGWDQVSYGTRTTCIAIDNNAVFGSGEDANCDGDSLDPGDEIDGLGDFFEGLESGSGNDHLVGAPGVTETFIPGDGNDDMDGNVGDDDEADWSSSSAAMTIDPSNGTATGQGNDTYSNVTAFYGSDFDDVLIWDTLVTGFAGQGGVDTVDASAETTAQSIDLDTLDDLLTADSTENAIGGSADDDLFGNDLRNVLTGNDGNDELDGEGGNDTFFGGLGNDDFDGGDGADTVDFGQSPAKIDADVLLGIATGEGDDSLAFVEIVKGSAFNDTIVGGGGLIATNFRITGRAGNDILTGSGSNDTLKGGAGKDKLRGLEGGDTLVGGKGNDKAWGGPGTDVCKGVEWEKSCEI